MSHQQKINIHIAWVVFIIAMAVLFIIGPGKPTPTVIKPMSEPECNYTMPDGYYLVKSRNTGKYAIERYSEILEVTWGYVNQDDNGFIIDWGSGDKAKLFDDSCQAKRFVLEWKGSFDSFTRVN